MGFFNEIKKALFGAKAVTKSAVNKATEKGKEAGEELMDRSEVLFEQAKDKAGELWEKAQDKMEDLWEKPAEKSESPGEQMPPQTGSSDSSSVQDRWSKLEADLAHSRQQGPPPQSAATDAGSSESAEQSQPQPSEEQRRREEAYREFREAADRVGNQLLDASEEAGRKFMDLSERVGEQLREKGGAALETAKIYARQLLDKANEMAEKAKEEAGKDTLDEMMKRAEALSQELEEKVQQTRDRFAGKTTKNRDSLLDDKDDFFAKAKRFAEGDYGNKGKTTPPPAEEQTGDLEIRKNPDYQPKLKEGTVPGFEDTDGDGNELIDDAIIDDDK